MPPKPTNSPPKPFIHMRATDRDIAALDRIATAWAARNSTGRLLSRSDVVRTLIDDEVARLDAAQVNGKRPRKKIQESTR